MIHPLLGRASPHGGTPIRKGGATGKVGSFGLTRIGPDGKPKEHKGIDLLAVPGWPVFATHSGHVIKAGWENPDDPAQGYGLRVTLALPGTIETRYAHLSELFVVEGGSIMEGTVLGLVGRTGNISIETPTHLHFEVRQPAPVDPLLLMV